MSERCTLCRLNNSVGQTRSHPSHCWNTYSLAVHPWTKGVLCHPHTRGSTCRSRSCLKSNVAVRLPGIGRSSTITCMHVKVGPYTRAGALTNESSVHGTIDMTSAGVTTGTLSLESLKLVQSGNVRSLPRRVEGTGTSTSPRCSRTCRHPVGALRDAVREKPHIRPVPVKLHTKSNLNKYYSLRQMGSTTTGHDRHMHSDISGNTVTATGTGTFIAVA